MKQLILVFVIVFFSSSNAFAEKGYLGDFNDFLETNERKIKEYGVKGLVVNICKEEKRMSKKWLEAECMDRPGGTWVINNKLKIKFYKDRSNLPWDAKPNFDTLLYYGFVSVYDDSGVKDVGSKGSSEPYKFSFNLREDSDVKKEINEKDMLSYLLYEDDKIVIDEK